MNKDINKFSFIVNNITHQDRGFRCKNDYIKFETILEKALAAADKKHPKISQCPHNNYDVISYSITAKQVSLLINGHTDLCIQRVMRNAFYEYAAYFKAKYPHFSGPLFDDEFYLAENLDEDMIPRVLRLIHQSHDQFKKWPYSSYQDYLTRPRLWVNPDPAMMLFKSFNKYRQYIDNVVDYQVEKTFLNKYIKTKSHLAKYRLVGSTSKEKDPQA